MNYNIVGYEGLYSIDRNGNVYSHRKNKYLKWNIDRNGYARVPLYDDNGNKKYKQIHRLVAQAFLKNVNNYKCVNHIDCNKLNNNVNNLEWCDYSYNNKYAYKYGNKARMFGSLNGKSKKIRQYDINGNYIRDWDSMCICSRELRISQSSISDCCNGKRKSAGNFLFRKVD